MKTPRTDAARFHLVCHFDQGGVYDANPKRADDGEWVPVDVCTQLETELIATAALADRLAEASKACFDALERIGWPNEAETLREALAAYENHKKGNTP